MSLALDSTIDNFVQAELIENLWTIFENHPYNDILLVSIIRLFTKILLS
jgi:hypothetical protein